MHKISFQMPKEALGLSLLFKHIFEKMSHNVQRIIPLNSALLEGIMPWRNWVVLALAGLEKPGIVFLSVGYLTFHGLGSSTFYTHHMPKCMSLT